MQEGFIFSIIKMKKLLFFIGCLLFLDSYSFSQNLVPNSSFENITTCTSTIILGFTGGIVADCSSPSNGTADVFNSCSSAAQVQVPTNNFGFESAHTGNGYAGAGFYSFEGPPTSQYYIEYIQVKLDTILVANKIYCASLYINLANISKYAIKNFGMYFSNNPIYQLTNSNLHLNPQIIDTNYIADTLNWVHFASGFTAIGGERYLTIGNFNDSIHSDTLSVRSGSGDVAYYYIDDVDVHLYNPAIDSCCVCNGNNGIKEQENENWQWALLPNPNNGEFRLSTKYKAHNIQIEITDVLGQLIYTTQQKETNTINITLNQPPGLYFVTLLSDNKRQVLKLMKE